MKYAHSSHLSQLISDGKISIVKGDLLMSCNDAICNRLVWLSASVDWEKSSYARHEIGSSELKFELAKGSFSKCKKVIYWYCPREDGLLGDKADIDSIIDEIYWRAPGLRFVFGAKTRGEVDLDVIGGYDGMDGFFTKIC